MKNMRWLISGFLMGLVMALAPSCGPTSAKCNASTCPAGCCSADGRCEPGAQTSACGISGNACQECGFNQQCQAGICTFLSNPNADGGTKPKDGGMNENDGGPSNDCLPTECKAQNGACIPFSQQNNLQCGNLGNSCTPCTNPLTCDTTVGACRDNTCNGCVNNGGTCVTGTSNSACGIAGVACDVCGSGETCQNGVCTGSSGSCGPDNCNGCCSNGVCVSGGSPSACGTGGNACMNCGSGSCNAGVCNSSGTAKVGSACTTNSDCAAVGVGAICKKTTASGNGSYTGGYCTLACTSATDCGSSATCVNLPEFGEQVMCLDICSASDPCRGAGYKCYMGSGATTGFCWIDPQPTPATPPSGFVGNSCTGDSQCDNSGTYPAGFCITQSSNNWPNGYCSGECTLSQSCASDAVCLQLAGSSTSDTTDDFYGCMKTCTTAGAGPGTSCKTGYTCSALQLQDPNGFCGPKCTSNSECPTSYPTCNTTTGNCCNGSVCI